MADLAELAIKATTDDLKVLSQRMKDAARESKKTEAATDKFTQRLQRMEKQAERVAKRLGKIGSAMSIRVTAPVLAAGAASVRMASSFDSSLTKINTLVGASRQEVADFRREILALGPAVGRGPRELAEGLFAVTSAGQRGTQALDTLEKAAKASAIGLGETREVALASVAAVQAYGEANLDASKSMEILIGTIEQGNLEASSLTPVLGRVIGIAAELGVAFEDVGAFIATFSRLGVDAAESTTALRGILSALMKPSEEARDAFNSLGFSVEQFRGIIKDEGFINAFQMLVTRARNAGVDISALVPNVRALSGVLGVFGGEGETAQRVLEGVSGAVGTLEDRFQAVIEQDPAMAVNMMRAELEAVSITIGTQLMPAWLEFVESIADAARWFSELDADTQQTIIRTTAFAAALGPVLIVLSSLVSVGGAFLGILVKLKGPMALMITRMGGLAAAAAYLGVVIYQGAKSMSQFEERSRSMRRALDDATAAVDRFSEAHHRLLNDMMPVPATVQEIEEEIASLETRYGRFVRRWGEDSEAAEGIRLRIEQLQTALEALGGSVPDKPIINIPPASDVDETAEAMARLLDIYRSATGSLSPMTALNNDFAATLEEIGELSQVTGVSQELVAQAVAAATEAFLDQKKAIEEGNDPLEEYRETIEGIIDTIESFNVDPLDAMMSQLEMAMEVFADNPMMVEKITAAMVALSNEMERVNQGAQNQGDAFQRNVALIQQGLQSIQSMTDEGSQAWAGLQVLIDAANVAAAIHAVLTQGGGDPYSAFARMAAMAAAVAQLGVSIGNFTAGSGGASAEETQRIQGTGTILGMPDQKSESIANAVEITANATEELVGINRGMLHALRSLESGIGGAVGFLARGARNTEFGDFAPGGNLDSFLNFLDPTGILTSLLGGDSEVVDQGIEIVGGALTDLINSVAVGAFQTVSARRNIFDDYDDYTDTQALDDSVGEQFALIFQSIAGAVREGALALGLSADEIDSAIAQFEVATQRISLMDLSPEEQEAELMAVFSAIFDGLAGEVAPFIGQFQQAGEGLGETLIRVATGVQVTQEAIHRLGLAIDETDPEKFAQISEGLINAAGGLEAFTSGMNRFVSRFATDSFQFDLASRDITSALDQMGIAVPATREGFWELMQTIDATTEAGQQQIATLLSLTDAADQFYSFLEDRESERMGLQRQLLALQGNEAELRRLHLETLDESNRALQEQIWLLEDAEAAREAENQRMEDLAGLMRDVSDQILDMTASAARVELHTINRDFEEMTQRARELGASEEQLAQIRALHQVRLQQLAGELESSLMSLTEELFGTADTFDSVATTASSATNAMQGLAESIRMTIISIQGTQGLSTLDPVGQRDFLQDQFDIAVNSGNFQRANQIASQLAQSIRAAGSSGQEADAMIEALLADLERIEGLAAAAEPPTGAQVERISESATNIEGGLARQIQLSADILDQLGVLSEITGESAIDIAERLGIPLERVVGSLIDVSDFGADQVHQLGLLAMQLGLGIGQLAEVMGLNLGEVTDETSLLNEALRGAITELPKDMVPPLLAALRQAEDSGDVSFLESLVAKLPADLRNQLAPFLDGIEFTDPAAEALAIYQGIESWTKATAVATQETAKILMRAFPVGSLEGAKPIPQYNMGTKFVPEDGPAYLHRGEAVVPANENRKRGNDMRPLADKLDALLLEFKKQNQLLDRQQRRDRVKL